MCTYYAIPFFCCFLHAWVGYESVRISQKMRFMLLDVSPRSYFACKSAQFQDLSTLWLPYFPNMTVLRPRLRLVAPSPTLPLYRRTRKAPIKGILGARERFLELIFPQLLVLILFANYSRWIVLRVTTANSVLCLIAIFNAACNSTKVDEISQCFLCTQVPTWMLCQISNLLARFRKEAWSGEGSRAIAKGMMWDKQQVTGKLQSHSQNWMK